jgi:hypothetical protein
MTYYFFNTKIKHKIMKMRKISALVILAVVLSTNAFSQNIGIGTNANRSAPVGNPVLDVSSVPKGFPPPRMTYAQKMSIASPVTGLVVYCTDCGVAGELQVYNGTTWTKVMANSSSYGKSDAPTIGTQEVFSRVTETVVPNSITIGITVTAKPGSARSATKPYDILTVTDASPANEIILSAETNTVPDNLKLSIGGNPDVQYSISLYDVSGKLLFEKETTGNTTAISMVSFPPSTYLLKVLQERNEIRTFRIIKN